MSQDSQIFFSSFFFLNKKASRIETFIDFWLPCMWKIKLKTTSILFRKQRCQLPCYYWGDTLRETTNQNYRFCTCQRWLCRMKSPWVFGTTWSEITFKDSFMMQKCVVFFWRHRERLLFSHDNLGFCCCFLGFFSLPVVGRVCSFQDGVSFLSIKTYIWQSRRAEWDSYMKYGEYN